MPFRMSIGAKLRKIRSDPEIGLLVAASKLARYSPWQSRKPVFSLPPASTRDIERTIAAFNSHGSDKGDKHSYGPIYAALLTALPSSPRIMELGIGTNFTDVLCNMGEDGRPGASLRAFRELRPDAVVFGADIDRRVLFDEPGISTFWVDQLDRKSLAELRNRVGGERSMNLIIDDGLHSKRSNLNSFRELFPAVKPGGYYVIEDIDGSGVEFWRFMVQHHGLNATVLDLRAERNWEINNMVVVAA
jgi:SAM-dependent methyltransferase